ncbi:MAG: hypothetical protein ABIF10_02200 [Candidatus Woesearchaeota archaeon]
MKKILLATILLSVLLGCTSQNTQTSIKSTPFVGGTTGVTIGFSADSPPVEVDDGGQFPFDVVVELRNMGEHTVRQADAEVIITGIKPEQFSKTEGELKQQPEEDLTSTKKDPEGAITEGPPVFVTFSGFNHKQKLVGNKEFTIRAEVCYLYKTNAMAQLCVRKDNINPEKEGVCEVSEQKTIYGSGAPVQVTSFKEYSRAKNKVGFQFEVTHLGKGDIFEKTSKCNTERRYGDRVFVEVNAHFDSGLKCSGLSEGSDTSGYVKLYGDKRIVSCTQEVNTNSDYETPVDITLTYDYREGTQTPIIIKHLPEEEE